jgi:hypothetical protein
VQAVREGRVPGMAIAEPPPAVAHAGAGAGGMPCLSASGALSMNVHLGCASHTALSHATHAQRFELRALRTRHVYVSTIRRTVKVRPCHAKGCPWRRVAPSD